MSANWWLPCKDICFVTDRPTITKLNDAGVIHCEEGAAIQYKDGFSVYAWNGTRVPEEWILNKKDLTPKIALTWENIEQRRAACEILGWHNVLEHPSLNPKVIDKDKDPTIGELIEVDLPEIGRERFLKILCATNRTFAMPVPPEMETAHQANAWTWGLEPKDYLPTIQS